MEVEKCKCDTIEKQCNRDKDAIGKEHMGSQKCGKMQSGTQKDAIEKRCNRDEDAIETEHTGS